MSISKKIAQLEAQKKEILTQLETYSYDQLNRNYAENEWSLTQVISHIIESETGTGKYLNKKLKDVEVLKNTGLKNKMNSIMLGTALKSSKKFKAPKVVANPTNNLTYDELKTKWDENRQKLIETINLVPKEIHNKAIFKHPIAGPLNINQTIDFLVNHLTHHRHQIKKIAKELKN